MFKIRNVKPTRTLITLLVCIILILIFFNRLPLARNEVPKEITIAFMGDQGLTKDSRLVLEMIRREADMLVHLGDFDYQDSANLWERELNLGLGEGFPMLAVIGNHDVKEWEGYKNVLKRRLANFDRIDCEGEIGVNFACSIEGVFIALSGVGTFGENHLEFLQSQLSNASEQWKICAWHKNHASLQAGNKVDEVPLSAYEMCRESGAFVANGHEHIYSRTFLLSSYEKKALVSRADTLVLEPGKSFTFVSGIGGHSIRSQNEDLAKLPYWASIYTENQNARPGALFCKFNIADNPKQGSCYFKNIDEVIIDSFEIRNTI